MEYEVFNQRKKIWEGLGRDTSSEVTVDDMLRTAGMDWNVAQMDLYTEDGCYVPGYKLNCRDDNYQTLAIVSNKYKVIQNAEAFSFVNQMVDEGITVESAGIVQGGRKVWMLAKLPEKYFIAGDEIVPYFLIINSHDGSTSIKTAMTPVRVLCANTLNFALRTAKRTWMYKHTTRVKERMNDAWETIVGAKSYMHSLGKAIDELSSIKLSERRVSDLINEFFPVTVDMTEGQRRNNQRLKADFEMRYFEAPDLADIGNNGYKFMNAISDFATHSEPIRKTENYQENLFMKTAEGNPLIDKAYQMLLPAA